MMAGIDIPFSSSEAMAGMLLYEAVVLRERRSEVGRREGVDTIERTTARMRNRCGFDRDTEGKMSTKRILK